MFERKPKHVKGGTGSRRERSRRRRRVRKMDRDGGSKSGCWVRLLELAVDIFRDELFLITKQGVLTDSSYAKDTKGGKLSGTSHKGGEIWDQVQRVDVWRASWSSTNNESKYWVTRLRPQTET